MKAIQLDRFGGPEVLSFVEIPKPVPKPDEAIVKIEATGINYIDIYHRTGLYPNELPLVPGVEAAGIVESVGSSVKEISVGDRVAYVLSTGSYAEYARVPAWKLVPLPGSVSFEQGAATMLQGMTADFLLDGAFSLKKGQTALFHAAAGGVGTLFIQMAKRIGARVIGTVSTEEKAATIKALGADEAILYTKKDFETEIKRLTDGGFCDVVYDSVGKDTFEKSLRCLKPRGYLILFGQSSGLVPPFDPRALTKGSLFMTRPSLGDYVATREELLLRSGRVHKAIVEGMKVFIERTFPLSEAAAAQALLESRKTTGKVILEQ
jgi:NADPH:quinone reductase